MRTRLEATAEAVLLLTIVLAPWPYGAAADPLRYALVALVLLAVAVFAIARALPRGSGGTGESPPLNSERGFTPRDRDDGLPYIVLPAAALPALGLVQIALGTSAAPQWTAEAVLVLAAMMAALVFWSERGRDRAAALRLTAAVLGVCAAEAVFGAVQWSLGPDRIYGRTAPIVTSPFGSYVNHNHFAGLLEMGIVLGASMALGLARRGGGATPRVVSLAGLSLGLAAVHVASRSRAGLVALAGGLLVAGMLWARVASHRPGRTLRVAPLAFGAVVVIAFGLAVVPENTRAHLATLFRGGGDASGDYRLDVARDTLRLAVSRPVLGAGLGAYGDAFPAFKSAHGDVRTTHAEDDALEFLAETGLAGLAIAAWLAVLAVRGLTDRLRHGRDPFRKSIAVGAAGAVAALALHSLADFNLRLPANALVFASLLGLAAAPREPACRMGGRALPAVAAALLLLLSAAAGWRAAGALSLERALGDEDPQMRVAALDPVLRRHPYLADAYRARGLAWRDLAVGRSEFAPARLDRAERDLSRAVRLRPAWGEAWADLAWARLLRGDAEKARVAMERAASLDRTHPYIAQARTEMLTRLELK
jgi:tetratricopeptide (TPR) repeat protein